MADAVDPAERIEALLNKAEPRIARAFMAAIEALKKDLDLKVIEDLLANGDIEGALKYTQNVARSVGQMSAVTFIESGQDTAKFLSGLDLGTILFDQLNIGALNAMQGNNLRLINEFTAEQRRATHVALLDGISRGLNPRDQARNFRDSVGLTERQQLAVVRYRRLLEGDAASKREALTRKLRDRRFDKTVLASIKRDAPMSPEQIAKQVARYQERYIKYRSEVIARTEALRSVHEGVEESYRQMIEAGTIDADKLVRTWDSSRDKRVRRTHRFLHGQKRKWGQTWATENGALRYPGDPLGPAEETIQCRCLISTRIKGASTAR